MAIIPGANKMSLPVTPQKARQKKLVYLLILVLVAIAAVYLFYFIKPSFLQTTPPSANVNITQDATDRMVQALKTANLNFSLLNNETFNALVLHGNLPVVVGVKGRDNPFAPF